MRAVAHVLGLTVLRLRSASLGRAYAQSASYVLIEVGYFSLLGEINRLLRLHWV